MPGSSSWMPYAPQGVKGFDDDDDDDDDGCVKMCVFPCTRKHIVTCTANS